MRYLLDKHIWNYLLNSCWITFLRSVHSIGRQVLPLFVCESIFSTLCADPSVGYIQPHRVYLFSQSTSLILRKTDQPSATVSFHITVDVQRLLAVGSEADCVNAANNVAFGQQFSTVSYNIIKLYIRIQVTSVSMGNNYSGIQTKLTSLSNKHQRRY